MGFAHMGPKMKKREKRGEMVLSTFALRSRFNPFTFTSFDSINNVKQPYLSLIWHHPMRSLYCSHMSPSPYRPCPRWRKVLDKYWSLGLQALDVIVAGTLIHITWLDSKD